MIPRLHLVTDDAVLTAPQFLPIAHELLRSLGAALAFHIRARAASGAELFRLAAALRAPATASGALLVINDRVDVALTARADAVQLGARTLPVRSVRDMLEPTMGIGYSAHAAEEATRAAQDGADFVFAGTIYETASHGGAAPGGLALLSACVAACPVPVLAIGGVTTDRLGPVRAAGAHGVAVIRAVWRAPDPVHAALEFARLLEQ